MNLHIFKSVAELNENLIIYVIDIANKAIASKGRFDFVLTGGNSPKELYKELSTTFKDKIDWNKVYFFFGDERSVLPNHKDYNGLMAKENLFDNLNTPTNHIFYVDTTLSPEKAAIAYKKALDEHFKGEEITFDLILLGMGDDAHTASIFPHTNLVHNQHETVAAVWVEKLNTHRISLTAPLINKAKNVAFITFGENKANALKHVIADEEKDFEMYPAQLIKPQSGNLDWFVDESATNFLNL
ncbi:6-phosphogluconolactonase [Pedobacter boryungensis]|uniref:6-phosphogluconolactonase n=1 Tax=Pedobacter boryungensis TaxID=869962 RepID=A0ABX2DCA7_9SPHI|nr:6-phosphogluconolactonase [Pedobacter boryungensis]NQX30966.1 6-phosphogluconolactonase [Pedobacter boryungensis]